MRRTMTLLVTLAAALSVAPASALADASTMAPQEVSIAAPDTRTFATASTANPNVWMMPRADGPLQRWLVDLNSTTAATRVVNVGTGGCLSVSNLGPSPIGALAVLQRCANTRDELWQVRHTAPDPTARFVHVQTGLCLSVETVSPGLHARLRVYSCGNSVLQHFRLIP